MKPLNHRTKGWLIMGAAEGDIAQIIHALTRPTAGAERRNIRRTAVAARGVLRILSGQPTRSFSVLTRDVSARGIGIVAAAPLERGVRVALQVSQGEGAPPVTVECDVRHCRAMADGVFSVGLVFAGKSELESKDGISAASREKSRTRPVYATPAHRPERCAAD
jgi:hypothetical protein